jgi:hypothetical protein
MYTCKISLTIISHITHVLAALVRCYLCRWAKNKHLAAHAEVLRTFGMHMHTDQTNRSGTNIDLFNIAGCILRLALWPTQEMWAQLDVVFGVRNPG